MQLINPLEVRNRKHAHEFTRLDRDWVAFFVFGTKILSVFFIALLCFFPHTWWLIDLILVASLSFLSTSFIGWYEAVTILRFEQMTLLEKLTMGFPTASTTSSM